MQKMEKSDSGKSAYNASMSRHFVQGALSNATIPGIFALSALKSAEIPRNFAHDAAGNAIAGCTE